MTKETMVWLSVSKWRCA